MHKMTIKPWQDCRNGTALPSGEIQIWSASLDREIYSNFLYLLSEDEKCRAARLKSKAAARQQIISRGILRILLGRTIGVNPEELTIGSNPFGKPFLSCPENSAISFNLAHSGQLLLIAIGNCKHTGIDVEKMEENIDFAGISALVFSDDEQQSLSRSKEPVQDFYAIWTAKEAVLKAAGRGFAYPSNKFCVVISKKNISLLKYQAELTHGFSWSISSFTPASGYSAAVAVLQ